MSDAKDYSNVTERDLLEMDWMYQRIYDIKDPLEQAQELSRLAAHGRTVKVTNVKSLYQAYTRSRQSISTSNTRYTDWDGQDHELETSWTCDHTGIHKNNGEYEEYACTHPLTISKRIYNIDSGMERIELQYKAGVKWRKVIVDKSTIASNNKIVELSNFGISVTSDNAKSMVAYLQELEAINYLTIPTIEATSRLGWVTDHDFMPYSQGVMFDGDASLSRLFKSVRQEGDETAWTKAINELRGKDTAVKIIMAASTLSPMMRQLNILPAFAHLWTSESSTGKTVILMAAASVWGDPEFGQYLQSFNSTTVALERTAETLNSLPLVMDELQLSRDYHGQTKFDVYKLAQGLGKGRGTKTGGIERTATWCNTIITSGETPIVKEADGQGAYARVLEIKLDKVVVDLETGQRIVRIIKENYGWAGLLLVAAIRMTPHDELQARYDEIRKELTTDTDIQDKQAMFGAGLILADQIADQFIYMTGKPLTVADLRPYLLTRDQTSVETRALDHLRDWIASNQHAFTTDAVERYGFVSEGTTYIIRTVFNKTMEEGGFNAKSVLASFATAGLIEVSQETDGLRTDVRKRMDGKLARFIALKPDTDDEEVLYAEYL